LECDVIVFDFDGVLYDGESARRLGVGLLKRALEQGYRVYIVSGRHRRDLPIIRRVREGSGVGIGRLASILLRDRGSETGFKLEAYTRVLDLESCILEIHDDNPDALWPARRMVTGGLILHHNEECSVLYGSSIFEECME